VWHITDIAAVIFDSIQTRIPINKEIDLAVAAAVVAVARVPRIACFCLVCRIIHRGKT